MDHAFVQKRGYIDTSFGWCLYIKIRREDDQPLSWSEVWATFADRYPDQWAVQFFPPAHDLVDEANVYHLFVLEGQPMGVTIKR